MEGKFQGVKEFTGDEKAKITASINYCFPPRRLAMEKSRGTRQQTGFYYCFEVRGDINIYLYIDLFLNVMETVMIQETEESKEQVP